MKQNLVEFVSLTDVAHLSSQQFWNKVHVCLAEAPAISRGDSRTCCLMPLLRARQMTARCMYVLPPRGLRQRVSTKASVHPASRLVPSRQLRLLGRMCPASGLHLLPLQPVRWRLSEMSWKRNRAWLDSPGLGRIASTTRGRTSFTGTWMCTETAALCVPKWWQTSESFQPRQMLNQLIFSDGWIPRTCLSRTVWLALRAVAPHEACMLPSFIVFAKDAR